ncbi:MAG: alanine--tRNA ligase, partial [Deltaproteobacteria bacterium]|nr:alanine--tRNA ligase [Nannocystaceae bacterium]
ETDLFVPLVERARALAAARHPGSAVPGGEAPLRVIADHARATAFLVADGVFPDRVGRSYVLRRIMRRAIRHGTEIGLDRPFFHEVTAEVVARFGDAYPELRERAATIEEVVRTEEEQFRRTLDRGLKRLRTAIAERGDASKAFAPELAADLYDTYGFPLDLTAVIVAEHGLTLDEPAAEQALRARQAGGEASSELGGDKAVADLWFALHAELGDTAFLGYDDDASEAVVRALVVGGKRVERAEPGDEVDVVLDRTPFYGEGGGQIGDTGVLDRGPTHLEVADTLKPLAAMHVHRGRLSGGPLAVGDTVHAHIDVARRNAIRRNHSATHLLHHALRKHLGDHVAQKGSLVAPDRLRFDFSHNKPIGPEERERIEATVNEMVLANAIADVQQQSMDDARLRKAIGLFEAKYGERVRVVQFDHSIELCGGTHVARTGDIGLFAILSEVGIAQGVRRIEAVTGMGALAWAQGMVRLIDGAREALHAQTPDDVPGRIEKLQQSLRGSQREIERLQQQLVTGGGGAQLDIAEVAGVRLLARKVDVDPKALRGAADAMRDKLGSGVVVLGTASEGKATLLVAVTKDLEGRVHAGKLVGAIATHVDGKGGGRPELAQAGGPKISGLDDALRAASDALAQQLAAS